MQRLLCSLALGLAGCASTTLSVQDRHVRAESELVTWRPASAADLPGHWRVRSIQGPAAAVLMDLAYWIEPEGRFSGAALFVGPPPAYQVLSGTWAWLEDGTLQLGEEAAPARVEAAGGWLRLSGDEGSLVLERAELR